MGPPKKPEHLNVSIESDLVVVQVNGVIDGSVAQYLQVVHDELALQFGYALVLQQATKTTTLTREARHSYFEWNKARTYPGAVAVVGANFATKTIAMLLGRAIKSLVTISGEIDFFDTDVEARVWLDEQRSILKKTRQTSPGAQNTPTST